MMPAFDSPSTRGNEIFWFLLFHFCQCLFFCCANPWKSLRNVHKPRSPIQYFHSTKGWSESLGRSSLRLEEQSASGINGISWLFGESTRHECRPEKAVLDMPEPTSVKELKSFLGKASYLIRFLPGLAALSAPLIELLKKKVEYKWEEVHRQSSITADLLSILPSTGWIESALSVPTVNFSVVVELWHDLSRIMKDNIARGLTFSKEDRKQSTRKLVPRFILR